MRDSISTHVPTLIGANRTLTPAEMVREDQVFVIAAAAVIVTLPTAIKDLCNKSWTVVCYFTPGQATLSGAFVGGASYTLDAYVTYTLKCIPYALNSFKWACQSGSAIGTGITQEQLEDYVGAMVSGNTETFMSVTYDDATGKLNFAGTKATGAEITTGTEDAKIVTPKAIADSDIPTAIATGAEITTGADNAKAVTCLAIADSAIPTAIASGAEINAGVDNAKAVTAAGITASNIAFLADLPDAPAGFDYVKSSRIGGTAADLDSLTYATMSDGETALVIDTGVLTAHYWNSAEAGAESDPYIIECDDDAGAATGRFDLVKLHSDMLDFSNAAAKATPIDADLIAVCDTADSNKTKKTTVSEMRAVTLSANNMGGAIAGYAAKATPIDADSIVICDSADTNDAKETTISELRAVMLSANNFGSAIAGYAAKATPIAADSIAICDSADTNDAKETTIGELGAVVLSADNFGTAIAGYAAKATPIDADSIAICDSADTNDAKETTISELRAVMLSANNFGAAIAGYAAKASPIDADSIVVCDSADTNDAKETTVGELRSVMLASDGLGAGIAALDAKGTPIDADSMIVCDSADTNNAKETTIAELKAVFLSANNVGGAIAGYAAKATPIDADSIVICDSADTNDAKETTIAELKTVISAAYAPADWTPTIVWATATPAGMTITAKYIKTGKLVNWWLHIESADPGAAGGSITSIAFDAGTQPADVGAGNIQWPVTGFHRKDSGAADTWTDMQAWLNCTAAAAGDRLVTVKNPVVWADNEVTQLFLSGSHYTA